MSIGIGGRTPSTRSNHVGNSQPASTRDVAHSLATFKLMVWRPPLSPCNMMPATCECLFCTMGRQSAQLAQPRKGAAEACRRKQAARRREHERGADQSGAAREAGNTTQGIHTNTILNRRDRMKETKGRDDLIRGLSGGILQERSASPTEGALQSGHPVDRGLGRASEASTAS